MKRIFLIIFCLAVVLAGYLSYRWLNRPIENAVLNSSFESGLENWQIKDIGDTDLVLKDTFSSAVYQLEPKFIFNPAKLKYLPTLLSGDLAKSIIMFNFYDQENKLLSRLTYVVGGTGDHGAYQNYIVDGIGYGTIILSDKIELGAENEITLNILADYNELTRHHNLKSLRSEDVDHTTFSFYSSCLETECLAARYDSSFLELVADRKMASEEIVDIDGDFWRSHSPVYLTNYLPSAGKKYLNICTPNGQRREISQRVRLDKNQDYLILADTKIYTGKTAPEIYIKNENDEMVASTTVNFYMAQTGWTLFGTMFRSGSEEQDVSLQVDNQDNQIGVNCINFDNIRLYKLDFLEKIFPALLKKRLAVEFEKGSVRQSRLDYNGLYSNDLKIKLEKEYEERIDIPIYDLYFDEDKFWNTAIREDYFDANFIYNNNKYRVKIKIRGDGASHWNAPVKSWRIDLKEPNYLSGQSTINLIRPLDRMYLGEYFSYYLAKKLNLIALDNKFIFLRVNDKPYGLMYEIEDWSGDLLEKNNKPAGDLYGEDNTRSEEMLNLTGNDSLYISSIERDADGWKKYSATPYNSKTDNTNIFRWIQAVNNNDYTNYFNLANEEKIIDWNVHSVLSGSRHQDNIHNNRLYFDNTAGQFEFIPWDVRLNAQVNDPIGTIGKNRYNSLMDFLLKADEYFDQRNQVLYEYVAKTSNSEEDHNFYLTEYNKIKDELFLLDNHSPQAEYIFTPDVLEKKILNNDVRSHYLRIENLFREDYQAKVYFSRVSTPSEPYLYKIEIASDDPDDFEMFRLLEFTGLSSDSTLYKDDGDGLFLANDEPIANEQINGLVDSRAHYDIYKNFFPEVISQSDFENVIAKATEADKNILSSSYRWDSERKKYFLRAGFVNTTDPHSIGVLKEFGLIPHYRPLTYFIASPLPLTGVDLKLKIVASNSERPVQTAVVDQASPYITKGQSFENGSASEINLKEKERALVDLSEFIFPDPDPKALISRYPLFEASSDTDFVLRVPAGEYDISETIIIPENMPLKIEPGVTLRFLPGASLISYSHIEAMGNDNEPIVFKAKDRKNSWGVLAVLRAPGTNVFEHCLFEGGGDAYQNNVYFSGMLSVYHADVKISKSEFRQARGGDDAVNLKNGRFTVEDNVFDKNSFDAVDLDFAASGSAVLNNKFTANGNDGLDISGSELTIAGNSIKGSGDKCVSVGEKSRVVIKDNWLEDCNFGLAVKDSSTVDFTDNKVMGNNVGAAVYNKKEIFGGATLNINRSEFFGNRQDFGVEVFDQDDLLKNYEPDRYRSYCYVSESQFKTSGRKTSELIKEPKERITSKKKLLQLKIADTMEDVGYKYATLANFCVSK